MRAILEGRLRQDMKDIKDISEKELMPNTRRSLAAPSRLSFIAKAAAFRVVSRLRLQWLGN
jgi:hypothetical protein